MSDYGMYSHDGQLEVSLVVTAAKEFGWDWPKVQSELMQLAEKSDCSEAMDTVVREAVYRELGYKTPFYV